MSVLSEMNRGRREYSSGFFRGAGVLGLNTICYKLGLQPAMGPLYLGWDITYRCNAKCSYCNRWKKTSEEITTEEASRMIADMGRLRVWLLSIGGGEPLIRKDMCLLIRNAKARGLNVNVNTNGFFLGPRAKELVESGVDSITVSAESYDEKVHDSIRNCPGLFAKLVEGIDEIKRHRTGPSPKLKVRFDITRKNYRLLPEYVDFWSSRVEQIVLQPIHRSLTNDFVTPDDLRFTGEDRQEFEALYRGVLSKYAALKNRYNLEIPRFFFDFDAMSADYRCFAGYFSLQVAPDLEVHPCTDFVRSVGNVRSQSLYEIWHGDKIREFRALARKRKQGCFCWYNCNGNLNCYLTHVMGKGK